MNIHLSGRDTIRGGKDISMKAAAVMQFVSKYASMGVQLVVTAVLARLVSPEAYGLMAIVTVFTTFFSMFADMGVGVAIVQFRKLEERDFGSLFAFSMILGVALSAVFCAMSLPISYVYGEDALVGLCAAAAPSLLFSCMNMVPNGLMLRERRFAAIGVRLVVASLVSGVVAIAAAALGMGAYALTLQAVLSSLVVLVWNVIARPIRQVNLRFMGTLRRIFSYSAWQFGFTLLNYFSRNLDNLVIGKVLGSGPLGYYNNAYKLTTYPMTALSGVVASVIQPFMAEHQDDLGRMQYCFWRVEKFLSLVGAPITAVMFCFSEEIVLLFYGDQWLESVPLLRVLSLSVYFQIVGNPSGAFYQSCGRTDYMFRSGLINTLIAIVGFCAGLVVGGLWGATLGVSLGYCLHIVTFCYYLLGKTLRIKLRELKRFLPEMTMAVVACGVCFALSPVLLADLSIAIEVFVKAVLIALIFIAGYGMSGQFSYLGSLLKNK